MKFFLARNRHIKDDFEAVSPTHNGRAITLIDGQEVDMREWNLLKSYSSADEALRAANNVRSALNEEEQ